MMHKSRSKNPRRGSTLLLLAMGLPVVLAPLAGLAIDASMCYIVQAKLQSAVDGAALGAGRLLGTSANIQEIADEFLTVNFPAGYWGARNITKNIQVTSSVGSNTIQVSATAQVPLLFLRVLRQDMSTIAATATSTRRDSRVILALDRSDSMNHVDPVSGLNSFPAMISSAKGFVGKLTPGADQVGLIAFGGSAIVAYPTTRPWDPSPTGSGGPDTSFATSSSAGPVFTQLNAISYGGYTATAEALSMAYIELRKSHSRDIAAGGTDTRGNAIVLFTDGEPTSIAMSPNDRSNLPSSNVIKSNSSCTYKPDDGAAGNPAPHRMRGWAGARPPAYGGWLAPTGLYLLAAYDNSHTLSWWLGSSGAGNTSNSSPSTAVAGCAGLNNGNSTLSDLGKLPPKDLHGNAITTGYWSVNESNPTGGSNFGNAALNAADNAAKTIRSQTAMAPITIYTIGYTGNGGLNSTLLKRIANTKDSPSYTPSEKMGLYIEVSSADQLNAAFQAVASDMLRLAR